MTPEDMDVGAVYVLRKGHPRRKHRQVDRLELKYEGEAPGPEPTGWFLDVNSQAFHAFRLSDVVEKPARRPKGKSGNRTRSPQGKAAASD